MNPAQTFFWVLMLLAVICFFVLPPTFYVCAKMARLGQMRAEFLFKHEQNQKQPETTDEQR